MSSKKIKVLDHGYVTLRNVAGPVRRCESEYDADDIDPANAARFSFDGADKDKSESEDLKLADYLLKNMHTTPFEMITIWLEMKMPIFVARQFVRHRTVSINEMSARYTQLPNEFYIPKSYLVGKQSSLNKQGRELGENEKEANDFCSALLYHSKHAYASYEKALENNIPKELARCFLPVNIYTKWLWKQDLWNMMHFLSLRLHSHAQYEARQYAEAMYTLLREVLPHSMDLFDKYRRK